MSDDQRKRRCSADIEFARISSKKSRIAPTDYSLCILCQTVGDGKLFKVSQITIENNN